MAANTICLYVKIQPRALDEQETWSCLETVAGRALGSKCGPPTYVKLGGGLHDKLLIVSGKSGSHVSMRVYSHGLVTIDVQHYVTEMHNSCEDAPFNLEYIRGLEHEVKQELKDILVEINSLYVPVRRGQDVWPYTTSADERILEMDYDKLVYEKNSQWQNIRIFHSKEFGNVLLLDGDSMLGESDIIYTQTLLCDGAESYRDKTVLILGGGDGGLLHELLKEQPKMVVMAEIDEEVIRGCRKHMRSICGDAMDHMEGPRHKILIEDCVKVLHDTIQSGDLYDYVINDLTEFPVQKAVKGFGYDLETTSLITELSLQAIKPRGKVLARGNCWGAYEYRERFEAEMEQLNCDFKRRDVFVPSFQEKYCLYEIWKKTE